MADTSSYSLEERLLASVWTHDRVHSGKSMEDVRHDFTARFGKPAPPTRTILRWEHKLFFYVSHYFLVGVTRLSDQPVHLACVNGSVNIRCGMGG